MENNRVATFANLGIDLSHCSSIHTALADANLDYFVEGTPIYRKFNGREIENPDFMETVRLTDGHSYGVVSKNYGIVQNSEAFDIINYINAKVEFIKGGETSNGMVYIICSLGKVNILGDEFTLYLLFRNSFNGRFALSVCICPLRIVCQNQFNISFRETANTVNIRHTINASDKMREAQRILANVFNYIDNFRKTAEKMAATAISPSDKAKIVSALFPITDKMTDRQKKVITDKVLAFESALAREDNLNFKGKAWGLINAYTDFITHEQPIRQTATAEENRFISVTFDPKIMDRVLSVITAVA